MTPQSICIYGRRHLGKTTLLGQIALYLYQKHGKPMRLLHVDSGGYEVIQPFIDAGIIEVFAPRGAFPVVSLIRAVARGGWLPWMRSPVLDAKGQPIVKDGAVQTRFTLTPPGPGNDWGSYSGLAVEGLTTISNAMLSYFVSIGHAGAEENVKPVYEPSFDPSVETELLGSPARGTYNSVQTQIVQLVRTFYGIQVPMLVFTGHEGKGRDPETQAETRGIGLVGRAATEMLPAELGDLLHIQPAQVAGSDGRMRERRLMYFVRHPDEDASQIVWPAVCRASVAGGAESPAAEIWRAFPNGHVDLDPNWSWKEPLASPGIYQYLHVKDEAVRRQAAALAELRAQMTKREMAGAAVPPVSAAEPAVPSAAAAARVPVPAAEENAAADGKNS